MKSLLKYLSTTTFFLLLILMEAPLRAEQSTLTVAFEDIQELMKKSPYMDQYRFEHRLFLLEHRKTRFPSNPEFSYSQENINSGDESEREHLFLLTKQFPTPWIFMQRGKWIKNRNEASRWGLEKKKRHLEYLVKSGYTDIVIQTDFLDRIHSLKNMIVKLKQQAEERGKQGFLAGYQKKLINMVLLQLEPRILQIQLNIISSKNQWKRWTGIDLLNQISLSTRIRYEPPNQSRLSHLISQIDQSPEMMELTHMEKSLRNEIQMEKGSFLPDLTLSGGYKSLDSGLSGPVFGLSFKIPFTQFVNNIDLKLKNYQLDVEQVKKGIVKNEITNDLLIRVRQLQNFSVSLQGMCRDIESMSGSMQSFYQTYREGIISIGDLTSAIQVFLDTMDQYHGHLQEYYRTAFYIEKITGIPVI